MLGLAANRDNVYGAPSCLIACEVNIADIALQTALTLALNKLGIKTYDMTECARDNPNGSTKRWLEAVDANFLSGGGRKLTYRRDLDDLLYRYQVCMELAWAHNQEQLIY